MARPTARKIEIRNCGLGLVAVVSQKAEDLEKLLATADEIPDQERQDVLNILNQGKACFRWANNRTLTLVSETKQ